MGWFTGLVLFALIWWTVLFAVLPIGTTPRDEPDAASGWRGTPQAPRMGRKVLWTTVVAILVWGACALVIESPWLSFRHGWLAMP
jgi:predicted secreted protein